MAQVIIVGGGLGGMSAAHTVLQSGGRVLVLDKSPFNGGNSTKATSGINGAGSRSQRLKGVADTVEIFEQDTATSAGQRCRPELVKALTHQSGPSIDWLMDSFGLNLDTVSRMAAHTHPRTHRGSDGGQFPGMMITYSLISALEDIAAAEPSRARVMNKAKVTKLLKDDSGSVVGVEFTHGGQVHTEHGSVVISTGGFGADFSDDSLLASVQTAWRTSTPTWKDIPQSLIPPLRSLPTTNGPHCTGDGIKMAVDAGAGVRDLEYVQVHPTGIVDPREPEAKTKWLAAEALRGHGGILLDREGSRFANELGKRDYVSGRMWHNNKAPYRLILNTAASNEIAWHCKHYKDRGLMKKLSGRELAAEMNIPFSKLAETMKEYNKDAQHHKETGQPDRFGKVHFINASYSPDDTFHVAMVTPLVHYCMGGIAADADAQVLDKSERVIPGLFAAGEVIGGIHGDNRLGGSSLLDCVVYGRISGKSAARHQLSQLSSGALSNTNAAGGKVDISVDPNTGKVTVTVGGGTTGSGAAVPAQASTATAVQSESAPASKSNDSAVYTLDDVSKHNTPEDCWVVVDGGVYNVTDFLEDHPGGKRAITIYAGKDATEQFNMMHRPEVLTKHGADFKIGSLAPKSKL